MRFVHRRPIPLRRTSSLQRADATMVCCPVAGMRRPPLPIAISSASSTIVRRSFHASRNLRSASKTRGRKPLSST